MQATIYVSETAMATAMALKDLSYHERATLSDDPETDLSAQEGYYLKNASKLKLSILPPDAEIGIRLILNDRDRYETHVSIPTNLRGCIFEKAPHLPTGYAEIISYWSGPPINTNTCNSAYFQNPLNEYLIDLTPMDAADIWSRTTSSDQIDQLLSDGLVVSISAVKHLIANLTPEHFIELEVPVQSSMLGDDLSDYLSASDYSLRDGRGVQRAYLKVADVLRSPDPDRIFIALLQSEMIDYGFYY